MFDAPLVDFHSLPLLSVEGVHLALGHWVNGGDRARPRLDVAKRHVGLGRVAELLRHTPLVVVPSHVHRLELVVGTAITDKAL